MSNYKVSVIIPTMNRVETLKETLDSFFGGSTLPDQLVVVDQSQDPSVRASIQALTESYANLTKVCYFYQETPSLTKARNNGVRLAENDLLLFSDDDVTVQKDTVENAAKILSDPGIAMIAGINSRDGFSSSKIGYLFGKKSYANRNIGHVTKAVFGRFPEKEVKGVVDTQWAMGFFFAVRKSLIEKWNVYWDEQLTSYAYPEDLDFSYAYWKRASAEGLRCILTDAVTVEHRVSAEWRVPSRKGTMMFVINREYLSYKHNMGWQSRLLTRWSNFGEFLFRVIRKEAPKDMIDAQRICDRHRKQLRAGILDCAWYEE